MAALLPKSAADTGSISSFAPWPISGIFSSTSPAGLSPSKLTQGYWLSLLVYFGPLHPACPHYAPCSPTFRPCPPTFFPSLYHHGLALPLGASPPIVPPAIIIRYSSLDFQCPLIPTIDPIHSYM